MTGCPTSRMVMQTKKSWNGGGGHRHEQPRTAANVLVAARHHGVKGEGEGALQSLGRARCGGGGGCVTQWMYVTV